MRFCSFFVTLALLIAPPALLAAPSADSTPASKPARSIQDIQKDIQATTQELGALTSVPQDVLDPAKRTEIGPKAITLLNRLEGLMDEFGQAVPAVKPQLEKRRFQLLSMKGLFGDAASEAKLAEACNSSDPATAIAAKSAVIVSDWIKTARDADAQSKVLDRAGELVKANPTDPSSAMLLVSLVQFGAASPAQRDRVLQMINNDIKGPLADQIRAHITPASTQPAAPQSKSNGF